MPEDVLELGTHLVHELGLEDSTDTLGRWLAHHLAELICDIDSDPNVSARKDKLSLATDIITKLWARREHLPGGANPIRRFTAILRVLDGLVPNANPWLRMNNSQLQRTAATLYDRLSRLTIGLLLLELDLTKVATTKRSSVEKHMTTEECRILEHLYERLEALGIRTDGTVSSADSSGATLSEVVIELADETTQELLQLKENVRKWESSAAAGKSNKLLKEP
jgi:hypothetical protein